MSTDKKYVQLYQALISSITEEYSAEDKLPTEQEIAEKYHISRQTVRKALDLLKANKYIYTVQGSGSYVAASSLTKKGPLQIAVIFTYIGDFLVPSMLRGIEEVASENQYSVLVNATNNSFEKEREILSGTSGV